MQNTISPFSVENAMYDVLAIDLLAVDIRPKKRLECCGYRRDPTPEFFKFLPADVSTVAIGMIDFEFLLDDVDLDL